jgi:hypothetical protein
MTTRTVERVTDWERHPFSGGYDGLADLADQEFSGVVESGGARLCMLNGAVVGILDGEMEDFEDAEGTAYRAPFPALPLLIVMQERSDEVRAKYYTEDTSIAEVNETLASGGFTGFVELSENVLSGDYYLVYHQGRSMSVAFVGQSSRLISGDEAFKQADDEVGIYEVRPVDIDVIDIPEPTTTADADADSEADSDAEADADIGAADDDDAGATTADDDGADTAAASSSASVTDESTSPDSTDGEASISATRAEATDADATADTAGERDEPANDTTSDTATDEYEQWDSAEPTETDASDAATDETSRETDAESAQRGESRSSVDADRTAPDEARSTVDESRSASDGRDDGARRDPIQAEESSDDRAPSTAEPADRDQSTSDRRQTLVDAPGELETRSIPSLDPERSWTAEQGDSAGATPSAHQSAVDAAAGQSTARRDENRSRDRRATIREQSRASDRVAELEDALQAREDELADLESQLADLEATTDDLRAERDRLEAEREDLQAELEDVRAERDELRAEVERLESRLEEAGGVAAASETRLSPGEAIDGTNLFVRYESKGDATLKAAFEGNADREAVTANLRLEHHTQFDADGAAVNGQPFEAFLHGHVYYQFVEWLVTDLIFEIRDTGHASALGDLYEALPRVDRIELNGTVSVEYTEDGETNREQRSFDVVIRDRMGHPLFVANVNDSRAAADENMMSSLITEASRVGGSNDQFATAFLVTASFFEPAALDTAAEATGGGLFSRDKRESYVRLSRKDGYHLCLVEARDDNFHLAVPEL